MMISIEFLRIRVGLAGTDGTSDDDIVMVYDVAQAMIENYCDRKFEAGSEQETFTHVAGYSVQLVRYPITSIISFADGNLNDIPHHIDASAGIVLFDGYHRAHQLIVDYIGGYDQASIPADLRFVLLMLFDALWAQNAGGTSGGSTGAMKQAKIGDLSVSFDTGSSSSSGSDSFINGSTANILNNYKRWQV